MGEQRVSFDVPEGVDAVARAVAARGGRAYLVGGSVRDRLLGKSVITDWDIEVHGLEMDALEACLRPLGRVSLVGRAFSVIKLRRGGVELDISLPRRDSKVGPGHKGIEAQGDPNLSLAEAFKRRDLTINAIGWDVNAQRLVDPYGGQADLEARLLRAVDAESFLEDPLRALRVVQFVARFEARVDPQLVQLCQTAALEELPTERLLMEWIKLFVQGVKPSLGLAFARESGQLARLFPGLSTPLGALADLDRAAFLRTEAGEEAHQLAFMMIVWLAHASEDERTAVFDGFGLKSWKGVNVREAVGAACAHLYDDISGATALRWLSTRAHLRLVLLARRAQGEAVTQSWALAQELGVLDAAPVPWVQGAHLLAVGLYPGPAVGVWVRRAYEAQLNGQIDTAQAAQAWIQDHVKP